MKQMTRKKKDGQAPALSGSSPSESEAEEAENEEEETDATSTSQNSSSEEKPAQYAAAIALGGDIPQLRGPGGSAGRLEELERSIDEKENEIEKLRSERVEKEQALHETRRRCSLVEEQARKSLRGPSALSPEELLNESGAC